MSAGDIGTAVLVHRGAAGYEVEFTSLDGETIAVVTLMANQFRAAQTGDRSRADLDGCVSVLVPHSHRVGSKRVPFGGLMKIKEYDCVVLTAELPDELLKAGFRRGGHLVFDE